MYCALNQYNRISYGVVRHHVGYFAFSVFRLRLYNICLFCQMVLPFGKCVSVFSSNALPNDRKPNDL
jgi:hypothetical protein